MVAAAVVVFNGMEHAETMGGAIVIGIILVVLSPAFSWLVVYALQIVCAIIGFVIGFINKFGFGTAVGLIIAIPIALFFLILFWIG